MAETARRLATWEDLLRAPDDGRVWEVLGGNLEAQPRPRPSHGRVQVRLSASLSDPFDYGRGGPGGWWLVLEPDVELDPHEIVVADLAGWRRNHLPELPEERTLEAFAARGEAWVRLGAWTDGDTPKVAPFEAIELDVGGLFSPRR